MPAPAASARHGHRTRRGAPGRPGRIRTGRIRPWLATAAAFLAAGALAACSGGSGSGGPAGASGGVLRIGTSYPIDSMNPFVAQSDYSYMTFEYIYPQLVQYDARLDIVPDFATSWQRSADGLTWTFHTRPHARWSDGRPLTAADAAWTINSILKYDNGPTANSAGVLAHVTGATTQGTSTLLVHYKTAVASPLAQLQQLAILPRQVWGTYFTGKGTGIKTFRNVPAGGQPLVSGGPFELVKYTPNQVALFKRNPDWYGRKPHIDGFGLQFFGNNDAMIQALKTGQVDFIGEYTPPTAVADLRHSGFVVTTQPSLSMKTFIINTNPHKTTHRELLNPLVREALEYATDRQQIIRTAWLGYATPGSTIIAPADGIWHDGALKPVGYSLAKANQLLDQAGYKMGGNGIRVADGHPMAYNVIFPPDERGTGDRTFQILQAAFKKIGIQISQQNMDDSAAFNAISAPDSKYQTFDMAMWDWVPPVDPDFMLSVMTCQQLGNNSDSGYCSAAYDRMYQRQGTLGVQGQRRQLIWQMQQAIYSARPYIILDYPDVIEAHSKKWTGFVPAPVMGSVNSLSTQTLLQVHQS
jgi:peptide/nickel transport system substrate-binding protein